MIWSNTRQAQGVWANSEAKYEDTEVKRANEEEWRRWKDVGRGEEGGKCKSGKCREKVISRRVKLTKERLFETMWV